MVEMTSHYLAINCLLEAIGKIIPTQGEGIIHVLLLEMGIFGSHRTAG